MMMAAADSKVAQRIYALSMADCHVFWAAVERGHGDHVFTMQGNVLTGDVLYCKVGDGWYCFTMVSYPLSKAKSARITLRDASGIVVAVSGDMAVVPEHAKYRLYQLVQGMRAADKDAFFVWFCKVLAPTKALRTSLFHEISNGLRASLTQAPLKVKGGFWLSDFVLYAEAEATGVRPSGEVRLFIQTEDVHVQLICRYVCLTDAYYAWVVVFDKSARDLFTAKTTLCLVVHGKPVPIEGMYPKTLRGNEFAAYVNGKPPAQKKSLRDMVCRSLVDFTPAALRGGAGHIIATLQAYVHMPATYCNAAQDPFNLHVESVIALGRDGVFLSGWMRDPMQMLESLELHTDLGYAFKIESPLFRVAREDVTQVYRAAAYGGYEEDAGFVAFAALPAAIAKKLEGVAGLHAVSVVAHMRGGGRIEVYPEPRYMDVWRAREHLLQVVPDHEVCDAMLEQCLAPALQAAQRGCMEKVQTRRCYVYGKPIKNPRISVIIPLYEVLDYISVQCAMMARDVTMQSCEIIYVLDSPWQEALVQEKLRDLSMLYGLPLTLVVMQHNSGYAAATHLGVAQASGEYLVLMNSDVFPCGNGWAQRMAEVYDATPDIGVLAPKLLYEDDSIQHAGMFFAKTVYPDWINLHYFKGYPFAYEAANISREVPAVTGACMMIRRSVWQAVNGLSQDYIIGDFEDSELCLACSALELKSWYLADVALYHGERQSVSRHPAYEKNIAWRYNARLHSQRWHTQIDKLMKLYGAA
jgi:GT2 family glycosyltransferase